MAGSKAPTILVGEYFRVNHQFVTAVSIVGGNRRFKDRRKAPKFLAESTVSVFDLAIKLVDVSKATRCGTASLLRFASRLDGSDERAHELPATPQAFSTHTAFN